MIARDKIRFGELIVLLIFSGLFFSCSPEEPLRAEVHTFRNRILADFNKLKSVLVPALENDMAVIAAGDAIESFLLELKDNDRRIFGIGLLDKSGEYLTGFVIDNITPGKLIKDRYKDMNFHSFKVVDQIVNSRNVMQEKLYLQDTGILAVGFPLVREGELLGILCFTFKSRDIDKKWGISENEFLKIDFGKM